MSLLSSNSAIMRVLSFTVRLWARRPALVAAILVLVLISTAADVTIPVVTGRLVAAVSEGTSPWALFGMLLGLVLYLLVVKS